MVVTLNECAGIEQVPDALPPRLAALYADYQCLDQWGRINPDDSRYEQDGGVHFLRDADWFRRQLALPGAFLLWFEDHGEIGYNLFFTDESHFPDFADEVTAPVLPIHGVQRRAYSYLAIVARKLRKRGHTWRMATRRREICASRGCDVVVTEHFAAPRMSMPSQAYHQRMCREWGAAFVGRSTHTVEIPAVANQPARKVEMVYFQYATPTRDGDRIERTGMGVKLARRR